MKNNSLRAKTMKGMVWSLINSFADKGILFITQLILARLLTPEDFGVYGIISAFLALLLTFVDSGMAKGLIREKNPSQKEYSTVFIFNLVISVLIYIIILISADYLGIFFQTGKPR